MKALSLLIIGFVCPVSLLFSMEDIFTARMYEQASNRAENFVKTQEVEQSVQSLDDDHYDHLFLSLIRAFRRGETPAKENGAISFPHFDDYSKYYNLSLNCACNILLHALNIVRHLIVSQEKLPFLYELDAIFERAEPEEVGPIFEKRMALISRAEVCQLEVDNWRFWVENKDIEADSEYKEIASNRADFQRAFSAKVPDMINETRTKKLNPPDSLIFIENHLKKQAKDITAAFLRHRMAKDKPSCS